MGALGANLPIEFIDQAIQTTRRTLVDDDKFEFLNILGHERIQKPPQFLSAPGGAGDKAVLRGSHSVLDLYPLNNHAR